MRKLLYLLACCVVIGVACSTGGCRSNPFSNLGTRLMPPGTPFTTNYVPGRVYYVQRTIFLLRNHGSMFGTHFFLSDANWSPPVLKLPPGTRGEFWKMRVIDSDPEWGIEADPLVVILDGGLAKLGPVYADGISTITGDGVPVTLVNPKYLATTPPAGVVPAGKTEHKN